MQNEKQKKKTHENNLNNELVVFWNVFFVPIPPKSMPGRSR